MARAHTSQTPVDLDLNEGTAVVTGVKYTFDASATVNGIWFWAPTTNSGTYTVGFYAVTNADDPGTSGTGTLLASNSIASGSVTAGAWNMVGITSQAVIAAKTYLAALHSSSGRFVRTAGAFTSAGISNGGINAIQSGTDPNPSPGGTMRNSTFLDSASLAYPTGVFGQPDYFVDVNTASGRVPDFMPFFV